jgi:hypothetical protein
MIPFPVEPTVSDSQRARGAVPLRYEDIAQNGGLNVLALPNCLSPLWHVLFSAHPAGVAARTMGVIPILARLILEGGEGPLGAGPPLQTQGAFELAHTVDAQGSVDRLLLNMWANGFGRRGRTHGPPPEGAGETVLAGRVFAEHVFTRLFAPASERKVLRFDLPGLPEIPETRHVWHPLEACAALPEGAVALDADFVTDPSPVAFGLAHTDSNQHVNSLVYPRLFEDAALRRFAAHGLPTAVLSRRVEVGFRKPCFAGERVRIVSRAFTLGERLGAVGMFVPDAPSEGPVRPYCYLTTLFEEAR